MLCFLKPIRTKICSQRNLKRGKLQIHFLVNLCGEFKLSLGASIPIFKSAFQCGMVDITNSDAISTMKRRNGKMWKQGWCSAGSSVIAEQSHTHIDTLFSVSFSLILNTLNTFFSFTCLHYYIAYLSTTTSLRGMAFCQSVCMCLKNANT